MAILHRTTLVPGKLELLTAWLPAQPWYAGRGREPELARAGGFRLDDPEGEVGIEFTVVTDGTDDRAPAYLVPLTYRAAALAGADDGLVGTAEHGVLGQRWVYDGTHDLVLVAQLVALIQGQAQAQAQNASETADPTVTGLPVADGWLTAIESGIVGNGPLGTDLRVETTGGPGTGNGQLTIRLRRLLTPAAAAPGQEPGQQPCLQADWRSPDGTLVRGSLATARYTASPAGRP